MILRYIKIYKQYGSELNNLKTDVNCIRAIRTDTYNIKLKFGRTHRHRISMRNIMMPDTN